MRPGEPRVAIVHDALVNTGGAERVAAFMLEAFPDAPVFTSAYLPAQTYPQFRGRSVRTLPGGSLVRSERGAKRLFPLWLLGFATLSLKDYDVVLTSTTWGAKFARCTPPVRHRCYCYAPFRLVWSPDSYDAASTPGGAIARSVLKVGRSPLARFDRRVTRRIPRMATTCAHMARRIATCYGTTAAVIHAPIRLDDYRTGSAPGDYYLAVSRLMPYKRIDLAIEACARLGRRLVVAGDGPDRARLAALAGDGTQLLGRVDDDCLKELYAGCRAVIFPSYEDYGLVPLEAQASERPVIAFGAGGALETVRGGETGVFFAEQTVEALVEAIAAFEGMDFDPARIRQAVAPFDVEPFKQKLRAFVLE